MIISSDNTKIDSNITTYKCPVINDGTVLLLPSQVNKYLGSTIRHKIVGLGIIINSGVILDIVSEESIDNRNWLLVIYNNRYYYTPSENVDFNKSIKVEKPNLLNMRLRRSSSLIPLPGTKPGKDDGEDTGKDDNDKGTGEETGPDLFKFSSLDIQRFNKIKLATCLYDTIGYAYPDPRSSEVITIPKGTKCILQSLWHNRDYNKRYFATQTFTNGAVYILDSQVLIDYNDKAIPNEYAQNTGKYCSMLYNQVDTTLPNGGYYKTLAKNTITHPFDQNWSNGKVLNAYIESDSSITNYFYDAKNASPLADSIDMFDQQFFGTLTITKSTVGMEMHRKEKIEAKYPDATSKLISISSILKDNKTFNSVLTNLVRNGIENCISGGVFLNLPYVECLSPNADTFIVTNYIQNYSDGKPMNFYVCFKKTDAINGAIAFTLIPDTGVEYIAYNKGIPDFSDNIPGASGSNPGGIYDNPSTIPGIDNKTQHDDTPQVTQTVYASNEGPDGTYGIKLNASEYSPFKQYLSSYNEVPPDYAGWPILQEAEAYSLSSELPYDTKHLTHINRFHLIPGSASGLSTKGFIFMTRPDLNLYHELDNSGSIDPWAMNPDLKRLPGFKYMARLKGTPDSPGIGREIMNSLEYYGTGNAMNTPWLTIMSNQAKGYSPPSDRELDIVEMGETFHGNKVIYAEPTFKYKIADRITIPFTERRDLTLYFTLRMWIEYIQAVSLGHCSPRYTHRKNNELDYAVSLYYIQTDETMENILYWEKLTGVIPLIVPDTFFEWTDNPQKNMEYSITFAYSFRSVLDEFHLAEINNLYTKRTGNDPSQNIKGMPLVPNFDTLQYDANGSYNSLMTRLASFYEKENIENEEQFNQFLSNQESLRKYYFNSYNVSNGSSIATASFAPNWNKDLQMHGVPYVKGPYIEHDPNSQKYILRWV